MYFLLTVLRMPLALSLHIAFLTVWSATLMYMPLLFLREVRARNAAARARAAHMQRWLYTYAMTPSALLAVIFGIWLVFERGFTGGWLPVKLALVLLMGLFHAYCGHLLMQMRRRSVRHRPLYYGVLPIAPALLIVAIVVLVTGKPF